MSLTWQDDYSPLQSVLTVLIFTRLLSRYGTVALAGYGIGARLTQISRGVFQVNAGSLFPAFRRLERDGLIKAEWRGTENNRRARYYELTAAGRRQLAAEVTHWERFVNAYAARLRATCTDLADPAYAGTHVQLSGTAIYRNQWVNFDGAPKTFTGTVHSGFRKARVGLGLIFTNDQIGVHSDNSIYGVYSYKIPVSRRKNGGVISMGIQGGFNALKSDYFKTTPRDGAEVGVISKFNPNFGAGFFYRGTNVYAGLSVPYILNNKIIDIIDVEMDTTFSTAGKQQRYYYLMGGFTKSISKDVKWMPSTLIRIQNNAPLSFDINNTFIFYDVVGLGLSYRLGDALVQLADLHLAEVDDRRGDDAGREDRAAAGTGHRILARADRSDSGGSRSRSNRCRCCRRRRRGDESGRAEEVSGGIEAAEEDAREAGRREGGLTWSCAPCTWTAMPWKRGGARSASARALTAMWLGQGKSSVLRPVTRYARSPSASFQAMPTRTSASGENQGRCHTAYGGLR